MLSYFTCYPKEPVAEQTLISVSLDNFAKNLMAAASAASFEAPTAVSADKWKGILCCASRVDTQSGNFVCLLQRDFKVMSCHFENLTSLGLLAEKMRHFVSSLQDESKDIPDTVTVLKTEGC